MCKQRIEKAAVGKGLREARWNVETKQLTLVYTTGFDLLKAKKRIAAAGHDTDEVKASDDAYHSLPDCCLYKDPANAHHHDAPKDSAMVSGIIMEENEKGVTHPIENATVKWLENPDIATRTNASGMFAIPYKSKFKNLIIRNVGYEPDTLQVESASDVKMIIAKNNRLNDVIITAQQRSKFIANLAAFRTEVLNEHELFKAACCNLSESFETNASVDVSTNDAITGSKQIQLLGISGIYTQLTVENLPGPTGLASTLGLNSISGAWIESIQIMKGTGSVVNGFENIAGQINVELKEPDGPEKLFVNVYGNTMGKTDINLNVHHKINSKWSSGFLLHDNFMYNKDMNFSKNGFRDQPTGNVFSGINRWKYDNGLGFSAQIGLQAYLDDRIGGEIAFDPDIDKFTTTHYGLGFDIQRFGLFTKIGYIFPNKRYQSIGLQVAGSTLDQDSFFGLRSYNANQESLYANLIYQSIIGNVNHKFRTGLSLKADQYKEFYQDEAHGQEYQRNEIIPGGFFEYTFAPTANFDMVAGIRGDHNSLFGWFATPRIHLRYQPDVMTTLRINIGRGQRTANIFAENTAAMVSSRQVVIHHKGTHPGAYGLKPEVAWNKGLSIDRTLSLFERQAMISMEFNRNDFINQVVVDYENPRMLSFYNLEGKSFSNSFQTEFSFMPIHRLETRIAYRYFDIKTSYQGVLKQKPLTAPHRGFLNLAYASPSHWSFDYTLTYTGKKRIPETAQNPEAYRLPTQAKGFLLMNAQVSKTIQTERPIAIYIGVENLTNFIQNTPIIAADQPFGSYFDSSLIWGPVTGRLIYGGIRFKL